MKTPLSSRPSGGRVRYTSKYVRASRQAYREAPPALRALLDEISAMPRFAEIRLNIWTHEVQAVDRYGMPCERADRFLRENPALIDFVLSLPAKGWQPKEWDSIWLTREEARELR